MNPPTGRAPAPSLAGRGRPLSVAIVALVVGAVLASTAVYFLVTFNGPPPIDPPRRIEDVAYALRTGQQLPSRRAPLRIQEGRRPATPSATLQVDPRAAVAMAARLGIPVTDIVALTDRRAPGGISAVLLPRLDPFRNPFADRSESRHPAGGIDSAPMFENAFFGRFAFSLRTPTGWRTVVSPPPPLFTPWHITTLAAMLATIAVLSIAAWALARAIARPLRRLALAAEQARAGAARPVFPLDGASEVRALSGAVAAMHDRLAHHAEGRTAMLAAIAHDLGTPLSRLAFWVEHLPDAARDRASADIDEMRAMIADTLRFARDEAGERDSTQVELSSLLDSLVEDMRVGGTAVSIVTGPRVVVRADPRALRRLFANLIGNAIRYGDGATLAWDVTEMRATITIVDTGPGIDPAQAERLFEPFVRGDPSRNRATGGTGLGLAIVRSIAARHGGSVTLANRTDRNGAVATVTLPVAR